MYKSTDNLVQNEQGVPGRSGYQSVDAQNQDVSEERNEFTAFFGQVKQAKQDSKGCCDFFLTFLGLLLGSIVWTIVLVVTLTLPLVMIVIGSEYFHDCRAERMIPIFLVVAGCVSMVSNVINLVARFNRFTNIDMPRTPTVVGWITTVLNLFLLIWFICGCFWVYSIYLPSQHVNDSNYCHPTAYFFSFWLLNGCFIFFGALVFTVSIGMCFAFVLCW